MVARVHPTIDELVRLQFSALKFNLLPTQPVSSLLSGNYASRLRGRGLTFEELRAYRPGDDIRCMDWKATARLRKPHVRVYLEERERPVLLLVDQRVNMFFGSRRTTKATAAAELAALIAWRALAVKDRVGAVVFGDEAVLTVRPRRKRSTVMQICQYLVESNNSLSLESESTGASSLNAALERAIRLCPHDVLVVVVTDFADADHKTRELTTRLAAHNDLIAALVYDPLGAGISVHGPMHATDGERRVQLSTANNSPCVFRNSLSNVAGSCVGYLMAFESLSCRSVPTTK